MGELCGEFRENLGYNLSVELCVTIMWGNYLRYNLHGLIMWGIMWRNCVRKKTLRGDNCVEICVRECVGVEFKCGNHVRDLNAENYQEGKFRKYVDHIIIEF